MASKPEEILPEGWEARRSRSTGMTYYLNIHTKTSQWDVPTEPAPLVDDEDEVGKADMIQVSHLLVKHRDSRRPSSWREESIIRTKEEALEILKEYRRQIMDKEATINELAKNFSDCSSAARGGSLGKISRGQMLKPFEEAAFALKVGQLSHPVESKSGVHIIYRSA